MRFILCAYCLCVCWLATSKCIPVNAPLVDGQMEVFRGVTPYQTIIVHTGHIEEYLKRNTGIEGLTRNITTQDAIFYTIYTHDFDVNAQLDGLEIFALLRRTAGEVSVATLISAVDQLLLFDSNRDGFINYAEWLHGADLIIPIPEDPQPSS